MDWLSFAWAAVLAALLLCGIGWPLARVLGIRGLAQVAVAPAFTMTIVSAASIVAPLAGIPWSLWGVLGMATIVWTVLAAVRYATRRHRVAPAPHHRFDVWLLVAYVLAATLIVARITAVIGDPAHFSQTFDNVFHLNAVRFVIDTANASSLDIGYMTNPEGPPTFYPAAWHGLVALVAQLSGASVPVAINAVVTVISSVVWPLGILFLTRSLFGRSRVLSLIAGLSASALPSFPLLLMDYGVLYPYQLGVSLLPASLAVTAHLLRVARGSDHVGAWWWFVALGGSLPGIALSHPGAFMAWLALSAPLVLVSVYVLWQAKRAVRARILIAVCTVAYLAAGAMLADVLRPPPEARAWPPQMGVGDAIRNVVLVSPWYAASSVVVAVLVLMGIVWVFIVRSPAAISALGVYLVCAILFVVVASVTFQPFRDALTGPWYNNLPRLAALLPIALVPLAAYGAACSAAALGRMLRRRTYVTARTWTVAVVAVAVVFALAMQIGPLSAMPAAQRAASASFAVTPDSALVSTDELALLARLDDIVPKNVAIAGSPWTGTSVAYALTGRPVLMPHVQMEISQALQSVNDELGEAEMDSAVCAAIDELGVGFVLDFPGREVHGGDHVYRGLQDLEDSGAVRLVDQEGDARLYEVTACTR